MIATRSRHGYAVCAAQWGEGGACPTCGADGYAERRTVRRVLNWARRWLVWR